MTKNLGQLVGKPVKVTKGAIPPRGSATESELKVAAYYEANPNATLKQCGLALGLNANTVRNLRALLRAEGKIS